MAGIRDILFGNMAVRAGLITEAQLKECLDFQAAERSANRPVGKLGEILASRGHLRPEQVQAILDGQASQSGGKFGEIAVRLHLCPQEAVDAALKDQKRGREGERRIGEFLVDAGALRSHHVVAVLECQGLSVESCPSCGQTVNLPRGATGVRCPGCSTALSAQPVADADDEAGDRQPLPEAPAADVEDAEQVAAAAAAAAKSERSAVFGGYRILAKLGANASGGLYLARKEDKAPLVTLKVFSAERSRDKGFTEAITAAARNGAKLRHPGITRVIDIGRDRGRVFCAAEYVEGRSLRGLLDAGKPLEIVAALRIAKRVAEILRYAHSQEVLHGEVKPSNIVLVGDGSAKLTNFGMVTNPLHNLVALARSTGSAPVYAAPELAIKGAAPTTRSDIYSLGATLYHMITGRPPYQGASPLEVLLRVSQEEAPRPGSLRANVPEGLDALVMLMLAADPEERPEDMDQVLRAIDAAAATLSVPAAQPAARAPRSAPAQAVAVADEGLSEEEIAEVEAAEAAAKQRKLVGTLSVLSILLVFAIAALVLVIMAPAVPRLPEVRKLPAPPPVPAKAAQPATENEAGPRPPLTAPRD